jgi:hypothetical protein
MGDMRNAFPLSVQFREQLREVFHVIETVNRQRVLRR